MLRSRHSAAAVCTSSGSASPADTHWRSRAEPIGAALGALVPVAAGRRYSAHQKLADRVALDLGAVFIDKPQIVTRHGAAGGAVDDVAGRVG